MLTEEQVTHLYDCTVRGLTPGNCTRKTMTKHSNSRCFAR